VGKAEGNGYIIGGEMVSIKKDLEWGLEQEKVAIKEFSKVFKKGKWSGFIKLGLYNHFDFCAHSLDDKRKSCFVEIKSRRCDHDKYEDTLIPSVKIKKALILVEHGQKVFLVVNFTDGFYYVDLERANMRFDWNARTDRGMIERGHYAFLPLEQFKKIG